MDCLNINEVWCYANRYIFLQPTARPPGNDFSYRRMDGGPHINGGVPQENSVPMHLTNGYADNMLTNVCPDIINFCSACQFFPAALVNSLTVFWYEFLILIMDLFELDSCFACHNNALQEKYWLWVIKVKMHVQTLYLMPWRKCAGHFLRKKACAMFVYIWVVLYLGLVKENSLHAWGLVTSIFKDMKWVCS